MKGTSILKKPIVLLLGLFLCLCVLLPVEAHAAELTTGSYTVTVPKSVNAGDTTGGTVTLSGTWAPNQNVTVTADDEITMTCNIDGSTATATATVNFESISKAGSAADVSKAITVDEPDVLFGTWKGEITYTVTVSDAYALDSISVTGAPTKTEYDAGETFDPTGLTITAMYANGGTETITTGYTVSPTPLTAGTTEVTITYQGKTATVSGITVEEGIKDDVTVGGGEDSEGNPIVSDYATWEALVAAFNEGKIAPNATITIPAGADLGIDGNLSTFGTSGRVFTGKIYGNGATMSNSAYAGCIFGYLGDGATIDGLTVEGVTFNSVIENVSGTVTISNCTFRYCTSQNYYTYEGNYDYFYAENGAEVTLINVTVE